MSKIPPVIPIDSHLMHMIQSGELQKKRLMKQKLKVVSRWSCICGFYAKLMLLFRPLV